MKTFECKECNFNYETEELAKKCEAFCRKYKSCSIEITRHAIESRK